MRALLIFVVLTGLVAAGLLLAGLRRRDGYLSLWGLGSIHVSGIGAAVYGGLDSMAGAV